MLTLRMVSSSAAFMNKAVCRRFIEGPFMKRVVAGNQERLQVSV